MRSSDSFISNNGEISYVMFMLTNLCHLSSLKGVTATPLN